MNLTFRRAQLDDTTTAQAAYRKIIDHLAETVDFPHWHTENHPTPSEVDDWIETGDLYLAVDEDGSIAGVVVLNHEAVDAYQDANWATEARPEEVLVVHALGVVPNHLGQGVARFLVDHTINLAREQGSRAVRLDTYVENIPARKLYERYGFTDLTEFHLFEYVL